MECFCGCGHAVPFTLRGINRQGARALEVQERLVEDVLPRFEDRKLDDALRRYKMGTQELADEGPKHIESLRAMVHGEISRKKSPDLNNWLTAARSRADTIVAADIA